MTCPKCNTPHPRGADCSTHADSSPIFPPSYREEDAPPLAPLLHRLPTGGYRHDGWVLAEDIHDVVTLPRALFDELLGSHNFGCVGPRGAEGQDDLAIEAMREVARAVDAWRAARHEADDTGPIGG